MLDGVDLTGTGSVSDMLWTRPAATVVGIDIPNIVDSASAITASCGARISLRIPCGETGGAAIEKLSEHLRRRALFLVDYAARS